MLLHSFVVHCIIIYFELSLNVTVTIFRFRFVLVYATVFTISLIDELESNLKSAFKYEIY
jgi:hypothetical protein